MAKLSMSADSKELASAISWVVKSLNMKDDAAHVDLLIDSDGKGVLSHSNQTSYARSEIQFSDCDISENGEEIALDGQFLTKLSSVLAKVSGDVVVSRGTGKNASALAVKGANGLKFSIPIVLGKTPVVPDTVDVATVNEQELFDSLTTYSKLCDSSSSSTPAKSSVSFVAEDDVITLMATNEFVLGEKKIPASVVKGDLGTLLIPQESASRFTAGKDAVDDVTIVYAEKSKSLGYRFADGRLALYSLTSATPLNYTGMADRIKTITNKSVSFSLSEMKKSVGVISQLSWSEAETHVNVDGKKSVMTISDRDGENCIDIPINADGFDGERKIVFYRATLNSALAVPGSANVTLCFSESDNGVVLYELDDDMRRRDDAFVIAMSHK